eukprot:maker-scaffold_14-snap-gene-2.55-mRNA-1 protein AED:0.00 eAED:0.00 QI:215/1/1/1/0/0/2/388/400
MNKLKQVLEAEESKYPDLKEQYTSLKKNFEHRLWHQLTTDLTNFVLDKSNWKDKNMINLYDNFVFKIKENLNLLRLAQVATVISRQFLSSPATKTQVDQALNLLAPLKQYAKEKEKDFHKSSSFTLLELSESELLLTEISSGEIYDADGAYAKFHTVEQKFLPNLPIGDSLLINKSSLYRVKSQYYRAIGPANDFYTSAVQFLAFTPLDNLNENEKTQFAEEVCVSALISSEVFNFGEVAEHKILDYIPDDKKFLGDLLKVFHLGDLEEFSKIFSVNEDKIKGIKVLWDNLEVLRQKIGLMAFISFVDREDGQRDFSFDSIATHVKLESEQIEWLIMKAMSKGLIKGKIDGVQDVVHIDWVIPRVINTEQVASLQARVGAWKNKVQETSDFVQSEMVQSF